jgi:hypothetical protein
MTNEASSFPIAPAVGPFHRYGGRIAALGEASPTHQSGVQSHLVNDKAARPQMYPNVHWVRAWKVRSGAQYVYWTN